MAPHDGVLRTCAVDITLCRMSLVYSDFSLDVAVRADCRVQFSTPPYLC